MFETLQEINSRPAPFEFYTAAELWTNPHTAKQMLKYHLHEDSDYSSRNKAFIERSVEWIATRFGVGQDTEVADFGCGPGLYATRLAEHGAKVTGIDFSLNSLEYARQVAEAKALEINYVQSDYLKYEGANRFDLIIMIMCDFCALSPQQRSTMLGKFKSLLKPGGSLLLDVYSLNAFIKREESTSYERNQLAGFWSEEDYFGFVNAFKYEDEKVTLDKYTIIEESGRRVVYNWLQYFSKGSIRDEFEANGLVVEEFFSDVAGKSFSAESGEFAVVAKLD